MPSIGTRKTVNALVPGVPMAIWAKIALFWAVYPVIRYYGGLWVGGTAIVTDDTLRFEPNGLNRIFLAEDVSFAIPLRELRSVRVEPAMATDIVVLTTATGERRVRCYQAKDLADAIEAARTGSAAAEI